LSRLALGGFLIGPAATLMTGLPSLPAFEHDHLLPECEDLEGGIGAPPEECGDDCQNRERAIEHGSPLVA
jgi:hypothetical protein